jgi:hypothetical protein
MTELGVPAAVPGLPALPWESLSHRQVLAELITGGWVPCGTGDWAIGLRSPDGNLVARVCPFDPAYSAFTELCRRCVGNPWLPQVQLTVGLEGGGSLTVLEFAAPVAGDLAAQVARQWRDGTGDAEFEEARRAAGAVDAEYRRTVPWWDGLDLNEDHVRRAADGRLVLIDIFCMNGAALYGAVLEGAAAVHRRIPREHMRYALEIPYIARESSAAEISALREAWARTPS